MCSYLYCSLSSDSESSLESEKQSKLYLALSFSILCFPLLVDFWLTQILILIGLLWILGFLVILESGGHLAWGIWISCWDSVFCYSCFLVIATPIFFFLFLIFAEETIWSPSTFVCLWVGQGLFFNLWVPPLWEVLGWWHQSCLYCHCSGSWEEVTNLFFLQKHFLKIFPALSHGVLSWTGTFSKGGGLLSEVSSCTWGLALVEVLEIVVGGHALHWAWRMC